MFQEDSAAAGASRDSTEKRKLAERLLGAEDWQGALDTLHALAEDAQERQDPAEEGWAVLGMAECLSKGSEVDDVLVLGMYAHSARCAGVAGDSQTRFSALAGSAELQRSLKRPAEAKAAWESAVAFARQDHNARALSFACTQLAFLLMDDSMEMVNENKQTVHKVENQKQEANGEEVDIRVGQEPKVRQAVKLLEEAHELLSGMEPIVTSTAAMNLAMGYVNSGGSTAKRKAERLMAGAFEQMRSDPAAAEEQRLSVAKQLVALHQDNPFLEKGSEFMSTFEECKSLVTAANQRQMQAMIDKEKPIDPEERHAAERATWAQRKLAEMQTRQQDSDSDDDAGPARPKGEDWRR